MARITSDLRRSTYAPRTSRPSSKASDSQEDLTSLIEDTISMIENTRSFLDRLDYSESNSRNALALSCKRLEEALASLKHRQRSLRRCEY